MAATKLATKLGGRPRVREPEVGKRTNVNLAVPVPLKKRLEKAAKTKGWSISTEGAVRLQNSFDWEADGIGGADMARITRVATRAFLQGARDHLGLAERDELPEGWMRRIEVYQAAAEEVRRALLEIQPTRYTEELK